MPDETLYETLSPGMPTHLTLAQMIARHVRECDEPECVICESI